MLTFQLLLVVVVREVFKVHAKGQDSTVFGNTLTFQPLVVEFMDFLKVFTQDRVQQRSPSLESSMMARRYGGMRAGKRGGSLQLAGGTCCAVTVQKTGTLQGDGATYLKISVLGEFARRCASTGPGVWVRLSVHTGHHASVHGGFWQNSGFVLALFALGNLVHNFVGALYLADLLLYLGVALKSTVLQILREMSSHGGQYLAPHWIHVMLRYTWLWTNSPIF